MSVTKRITGDYSLISLDQTANNDDPARSRVYIDTNIVDIDGDLRVNGEATFIQKQEVTISDNIITLNQGESGAGVTLDSSGIEVDRGTLQKASLIFDEITDRWMVDLGSGVMYNVLIGLPAQGEPLFNVVEDLSPQLGADLDVNGFSITALVNADVELAVSGTGSILLNGPAIVQGSEPATVPAGDAALYSDTDTGGGTQIHFKNDTDTGELVSKKKAIVYSLIF